MKKLLILTAAMVITFGAHAAQRDFAKLDTTGNSKLSLKEFLVNIGPNGITGMTKEFHRRDKDNNGTLTKKEYTLKAK